jgi:hypothetical protein
MQMSANSASGITFSILSFMYKSTPRYAANENSNTKSELLRRMNLTGTLTTVSDYVFLSDSMNSFWQKSPPKYAYARIIQMVENIMQIIMNLTLNSLSYIEISLH